MTASSAIRPIVKARAPLIQRVFVPTRNSVTPVKVRFNYQLYASIQLTQYCVVDLSTSTFTVTGGGSRQGDYAVPARFDITECTVGEVSPLQLT